MQCVILAGGLGTRMGGRTVDRPTAMIDVSGEPLIRHQLRLLYAQGFDDVVVCIGYRGVLLEDEVARHSPLGMSVRCISDGERLRGTAGAIRRAAERGFTDDRFAVVSGGSDLLVNIGKVWSAFDDEHYDALTVRRGDMNLADCGLSINTTAALLDLVPPGVPYDLSDVYDSIAAQGRLQAYDMTLSAQPLAQLAPRHLLPDLPELGAQLSPVVAFERDQFAGN